MAGTVWTATLLARAAHNCCLPLVFRTFGATPPKFLRAPVEQFVRFCVAVFSRMEFRRDHRESSGEGIFRCNFSTGTKRTSVPLMCSMPGTCLPFMSLRTDPPNRPGVIGLNIIRRDVSVFVGMPLSREQRMRLGERHKRLLPARGCPGLIHGPHATAAAPPLPTKLVAPLQGAKLFSTSNPGRRSPTRFALGYYLSGFQPFESACISVNQRLRTFAVFAPWRLCVN